MSDIETCKASVKCVLRTTLETGVPALVLVVALIRILGLRAPKLPIFHEFVSQETIEAVEAEDKTKPASASVPDADRLPTEQTRLLSPTTHQPKPKTWRQFLLVFIAILETGLSTAILVFHATGKVHTFQVVTSSITVASWVYAGLRPLLVPSCVPYYDLFTLYTAQFLAGCVMLCSNWRSVTYVLNVTMALIGIMAIVTMPLRVAGKPEPDAEGRHPALEDYCTLLEWMTFSWVSPMISIGANKALEESDVWQLSREMRTKVLMRQFLQLKRPSLLRRLLVANGRDMFLDMILTFLCAVLDFAPPVFLNLILRALTPNSPSTSPLSAVDSYATYTIDVVTSRSRPISSRPLQPSDAYLFALAACACQILKSQAALQHLYFGRRASVRIKAELVASVYEKALRRKDVLGSVSKKGQDNEGADAGKVVSLIAADAEWVATFVTFVHLRRPVSAILACVLLYNLMGWAAFAGYIALILTLPINDYLVRRTNTLQKSVSAARDIRIRALNEAISSIKFIKFSAWESRWTSRVLAFREAELGWLWKLKITNFFMELVWAQGPVMVAAIGFSCFTLVAKRELGVEIAFPALRILEILSQSLGVLPITVASSIRTLVSIDRIDKYLNEDDVPDFVSSLKKDITPPHVGIDNRLGCANGRFRWPTSSAQLEPKKPAAPKKQSLWGRFLVLLRLRKPTPDVTIQEPQPEEEERPFELSDVSVLFPEGVLSVVFGPTGSGKSSLLAAILGEMDCLEGEVYLPKEPTRVDPKTGLRMGISYCAQQPWLEHSECFDDHRLCLEVNRPPVLVESIKDNILFGSPFEKERYEATIEACALRPDLLIFEDGDETEIGEKGVSLSGGQKARVALARAVYARNKVVLLDDILSAVDSHTAEHLVSRCLLGPLVKRRTVVLITHHVDLVLPAAGWVVRIKEGRIEAQGVVETVRESGMLPVTSEKQVTSDEEPQGQENQKEAEKKDEKKLARKLVEDEKKSTGSVTTQVYMTYLSAASYWLFALLVLLLALDQIIQLAQKFWFKHWSESYEPRTPGAHWYDFGFPSATQNVVPYLLVYIALQATVSLVSVLGQVPTIWSTLHIDMIDGGLQSYMIQVLTQILALTISVATIAYAVPYFIIPAVIIAYLHVWFSNGYVTASRDLRRIESNTRSPIISGFGELLNGIVTVRAFGLERDFLNNMYKRLDLSQAATHYYWMCNRWLLVRFDTLGAISILIATVGSIQAGASAGLTGIVVTQAQTFVQGLYWALRFWTELEQSLNSVERIQEYLDLPSEPSAIINSGRPPAAWPSASTGTLVVDNLVLKYAPELEPVLNGVSFATKPSEKIGIVGRTGSGKSTLALALFRFVDPTAGKIMLDGIDITTIGLNDLRSRLTLIPQDPVLFKGTIRDNLDPFNEYTDTECIQALQRVHLPSGNTPNLSAVASRAESIQDALLTSVVPGAEEQVQSQAEQEGVAAGTSKQALAAENPVSVTTRGNGTGITVFTLETNVSEGGNNFSQGQRQLISMARALLRKSNVVIMDESTASVDFETDAKIQSTVREEFSQSILITIAHRLRTVIDNDRILVLSAGKVVEFDTPDNLLKKEQGVFHEMCRKSGDYDQLLALVEGN
ncbi:ABC transporter [Ceratobasidium sp. AG-Ba]|nr:ABC transporter [Ceratobasidium sp. AG-Ba]